MSDILFGHSLDQDNDSTLIPFTVAHDKRINKGENLALHYELYHLEQNSDNIANFEVEFRIAKKRTGLRRLRPEEAAFTLSLDQQSEHSYFKENLEVETRDLEKGTYLLYVIITDSLSKQNIERELEFEIIGD